VGKNIFVFDIILQATYNVGASALTSILPSLSLMDMTYFTAETKATSIFRLIRIPFIHTV
jgi:hypothetical protein